MPAKILLEGASLPGWDDSSLHGSCAILSGERKDASSMGRSGSALQRHAAFLLGRRLFAAGVPRAFSYGHNMVFCASTAAGPITIDAVYVRNGQTEWLAKFLRRAGIDCENSKPGAIYRSWAACEALLKLDGRGLTGESLALLSGIRLSARQGSVVLPAGNAHWVTVPFVAHWLCIAAYEPVRPELRLRRLRNSDLYNQF